MGYDIKPVVHAIFNILQEIASQVQQSISPASLIMQIPRTLLFKPGIVNKSRVFRYFCPIIYNWFSFLIIFSNLIIFNN